MNSTMIKFLLALAVLSAAGCEAAKTAASADDATIDSTDDTTTEPDTATDTATSDTATSDTATTDTGATDVQTTDAATTDSTPPDATTVDTATVDTTSVDATVDAPATTDIAGCTATDGLTPPAAKHAIMTATLDSPVDGYNGVTDTFDGTDVKAPNTAAQIVGSIYTWQSTEVKGLTAQRAISITLDLGVPAACKVYKVTKEGTGNMQMNYGNSLKLWSCDGSIVVDTISGKSYQFHFDGICHGDGTKSLGSIHLVGKGASTF